MCGSLTYMESSPQNLVKKGLRLSILQKKPELKPEFSAPRKYELTPEEMMKKERRKDQNRRAAKKCRERKKKEEDIVKEKFEKNKEQNKRLLLEKLNLQEHLGRLKACLMAHLAVCNLAQDNMACPGNSQLNDLEQHELRQMQQILDIVKSAPKTGILHDLHSVPSSTRFGSVSSDFTSQNDAAEYHCLAAIPQDTDPQPIEDSVIDYINKPITDQLNLLFPTIPQDQSPEPDASLVIPFGNYSSTVSFPQSAAISLPQPPSFSEDQFPPQTEAGPSSTPTDLLTPTHLLQTSKAVSSSITTSSLSNGQETSIADLPGYPFSTGKRKRNIAKDKPVVNSWKRAKSENRPTCGISTSSSSSSINTNFPALASDNATDYLWNKEKRSTTPHSVVADPAPNDLHSGATSTHSYSRTPPPYSSLSGHFHRSPASETSPYDFSVFPSSCSPDPKVTAVGLPTPVCSPVPSISEERTSDDEQFLNNQLRLFAATETDCENECKSSQSLLDFIQDFLSSSQGSQEDYAY